ncbi:MAG: hypothetical protein U0228_07005 [Myxococcaceae bacterium]
MTDLEVDELYRAASAKRAMAAGFRVVAAIGIGMFISAVSVFAGGAFVCLAMFVSTAVAIAFGFEFVRNMRPKMLFVVGQVTESGWALATEGLTRVSAEPRLSLSVEEAFFRGNAGPREVTTVENPFVVLHPKWMSRIAKGERVVLVCLPASTDPVHFKALPVRV